MNLTVYNNREGQMYDMVYYFVTFLFSIIKEMNLKNWDLKRYRI